MVDRLTGSLSALPEDDTPYHDALWGSEMSGEQGDTVVVRRGWSKSPEDPLSLAAQAVD